MVNSFNNFAIYTLHTICFDNLTTGYLLDNKGNILASSIECPWKDNQQNISCIPHGKYICEKDNLGKFQWWHLVAKINEQENIIETIDIAIDRSAIEIHQGNYVENYQGCIGLGSGSHVVNSFMITNTVDTLKRLQKVLGDKFILDIKRQGKYSYKIENYDFCNILQ